jgi:hypothetical protein
MINLKKINKNMDVDFDLLTEFARTNNRATIDLETELDIDKINNTLKSQPITISKLDDNIHTILSEDIQCISRDIPDNILETVDTFNKISCDIPENINTKNNELILTGICDDHQIDYTTVKKDLFKSDNNINEYVENDKINKILEENTGYIKEILTDKIDEIHIMNFDPSESILEDLDDYETEPKYSKRNIYLNNNDIQDIYKYLVKYRLKIKKKLINKLIIKNNKEYSDKLLFSLYLNLLFDDINIV